MIRHTKSLLAVLTAGLLSLTLLTACTDTAPDGADTAPDGADTDMGSAADTAVDTAGDTVMDTASDTAVDTIAVTMPETAPGTVTDTIPETTPATVPETVPITEPETASETIPETLPETIPETIPETEPETTIPRYDYMGAEVNSDVTLDESDYRHMFLTLPGHLQITDADVSAYIEYLRFKKRTATNGTEQVTDKAMRIGDDAYIYYKGFLDGEEFEGGSNWDAAQPHKLGLGSHTFVAGFEEGLVGVIPAEASKENPARITLTFPANYSPDLAGKEVVFEVAVMYAVQYEIPAYDKHFVIDIMHYEPKEDYYASDKALLLEFEADVRSFLEEDIAEDVTYAKSNALWTYLTEIAVCDNMPQSEIDFYFDAYLSEIEWNYNEYLAYYGTAQYPTLDDYARSYMGLDKDADWRAKLIEYAELMVKKDMIIHAIAEREGMESVSDEEYKTKLNELTAYYGGYFTTEEIEKMMGESVIRESALSDKMEAWLLEQAIFNYETDAETA